ncbi:MAG: restriction endonuclease subunit S [Phycisphaerae bacterium]
MKNIWPVVRLGEVCAKIGSGATPRGGSEVYLASGVTLIRSQNVYNDRFERNGLAFMGDEHARDLKNVSVEANDVLLNITGDSVARCCIAPADVLPARVNQHVVLIRPRGETLDPRYLRYQLVVPEMQERLFSLASAGATRNALTKGMIENLEIPLPPLPVQKRIAHILGTLDDKIELNRRMNETLEAMARAIFKSWFIDFDPVKRNMERKQLSPGLRPPSPTGRGAGGEGADALFPSEFQNSELGLIPKGWRVGRIGDLGAVICGKTPRTSEPAYYGTDIPFITIPDMHNVLAVTSTKRSLSALGANTQRSKTLPLGSICVSCIATAGLVAMVATPSQTNQQINTVIPLEKWGKAFPLFTLRHVGDAVLAAGSGGSVFHNLSKSGFSQIGILLPTDQLAQIFGNISEPKVGAIVASQMQTQALAALRDALLPKLLSGELTISEEASTERGIS